MDYLEFSPDKLSVEAICGLVGSPKCGAISTFIGTTRDNFEDKEVIKLEYEAYESMGLKAMKTICEDIRKKWPQVENIAIYHRLGTVPVKEASIVIAISSPHRADAIEATAFCIDTVKKSVPIWKKEVYGEDDGVAPAAWKENKESSSFPTRQTHIFNVSTEQDVFVPVIPQHLVQIKASNDEIDERIKRFMERKRDELNNANVRDFCRRDADLEVEFSCARIDSVLHKRKDSKGHLQVNKVYNECSHRDQNESEYLRKHIPKNGIQERVANLETQLSLDTAVPKDIYKRLKLLEERLLYLEAISPEYIQFWDKTTLDTKAQKRKKIFSIAEIDNLIAAVEKRRTSQY